MSKLGFASTFLSEASMFGNQCSTWKSMIRGSRWIINQIRRKRGIRDIISWDETILRVWKIVQAETNTSIGFINSMRGCESLKLKLEEGIIRVEGRYRLNPLMPRNIAEPIWIPENHPVTEKWLKHVHQVDLLHVGRERRLLAASREYRWLHKGWKKCRELLKKCEHCRRRLATPIMPPLALIHYNRSPLENEEPVRPFQRSGMDIFGPFVESL